MAVRRKHLLVVAVVSTSFEIQYSEIPKIHLDTNIVRTK